jgi:hypothetical protein
MRDCVRPAIHLLWAGVVLIALFLAHHIFTLAMVPLDPQTQAETRGPRLKADGTPDWRVYDRGR